MDDLHALNRRFLGLAAQGLPGPVAVEGRVINGLDPKVLDRLASLPFALFSFGFGADAAWETIRARGVQDSEPGPPRDVARERFALLALAYVRDSVRRDPRRAAVVAGVPSPVAAWLAGLDLGQLTGLAPVAAAGLRWRFPSQDRLWEALLCACREPDESLLPVLRAAAIQWTIRRALALPHGERAGRTGFRADR